MDCGAWRTTAGCAAAGGGESTGFGSTCWAGTGGAAWWSCGITGGVAASCGARTASVVLATTARTAPQTSATLAATFLVDRKLAGGRRSGSRLPSAVAAAASHRRGAVPIHAIKAAAGGPEPALRRWRGVGLGTKSPRAWMWVQNPPGIDAYRASAPRNSQEGQLYPFGLACTGGLQAAGRL
jgi:hypothetical protein